MRKLKLLYLVILGWLVPICTQATPTEPLCFTGTVVYINTNISGDTEFKMTNSKIANKPFYLVPATIFGVTGWNFDQNYYFVTQSLLRQIPIDIYSNFCSTIPAPVRQIGIAAPSAGQF